MNKNDAFGKAKGGVARAKSLSEEKRQEISKKGADARWIKSTNKNISSHTGILKIGDLEISCAVLSDGSRVVTRKALATSLGRKIGGNQYKTASVYFTKNLESFIDEELKNIMENPITWYTKTGKKFDGFNASIIPKVCDVWLKAREKQALLENQKVTAEKAEIIVRALANVGIIALIDEATGFQEEREKDALREILNSYFRNSLAGWAMKFPDEFYNHIFRLKNWKRAIRNQDGNRINPPSVVGRYTKDIVYARMFPGIVKELELLNPPINKNRKSKHHQWFSDDVGNPALTQHLGGVLALMKISENWESFKKTLDLAFPRHPETMKLDSMIDLYSSEPEPLDEQ